MDRNEAVRLQLLVESVAREVLGHKSPFNDGSIDDLGEGSWALSWPVGLGIDAHVPVPRPSFNGPVMVNGYQVLKTILIPATRWDPPDVEHVEVLCTASERDAVTTIITEWVSNEAELALTSRYTPEDDEYRSLDDREYDRQEADFFERGEVW